MLMKRMLWAIFLIVSMALAFGQSTISGVVKDSSGAVIANATVKAASEVLIERERTVTTNGDGRYAIVDLRPGTYVVTTTMNGFATSRQSVIVPANVSVPVDAELKPGSVVETIEVQAVQATVDIEGVTRTTTLTRSEMDALPTGRNVQSIASYTPGVHMSAPDVGGSQQIEQTYLLVHGTSWTANTFMYDGLQTNPIFNDGASQLYVDNMSIQETTQSTSNITTEASGGGVLIGLVPKEGGNQFHGDFFGGGSGGSNFWQGNNLSQNLVNRGLGAQNKIIKIEDFDGSFGGPIKKDKLWFIITGRKQATDTIAGPSRYDDGRPGIQDGIIWSGSARLAWQMNEKNKFSIFHVRDWKAKAHELLDGGQEGFLPSNPDTTATQRNRWPMYYILQTKWAGMVSPRMILNAGYSRVQLDFNDIYADPSLIKAPFTADWYRNTTARDNVSLRRYFAPRSNQQFQSDRTYLTANAAYVTGSHQLKFGIQDGFGRLNSSISENGDGYMTFNSGVPQNFTAINTPYYQFNRMKADLALFVQDTWRYKRMSLSGGLRWEYLSSEIKGTTQTAGRFAPARTVPNTDCGNIPGMGCWKNWTPRIGVAYDLFGNHKTALKAGFAKYNNTYTTGFLNNFNPVAGQSLAVPWILPAGANNPGGICAPVQVQGVAAPNPNCFPTGGFNGVGAIPGVGAGTLGASSNPSFGQLTPNNGLSLDPNFHRDYFLSYNMGIQQEVYRGVTVNFNWFRTSRYQQALVMNNAVPFSAWRKINITNPLDGSQLPVFYLPSSTNPAPTPYQTNAPQSLQRYTYQGFETSVVARLPRNMFLVGNWTTERTFSRACTMSAQDDIGSFTSLSGNRLNNPNSLRFCDWTGELFQDLGKQTSIPFTNEYKFQAVIPIYKGFIFGTSLYSTLQQQTNVTALSSTGNLGRFWGLSAGTLYPKNCVGCTPGARVFPTGFVLGQGGQTVSLAPPMSVLTDRLTQLDLSMKKTFKFGERFRLEPTMQVFNVLNVGTATLQSASLGADAAPYLPSSACGSLATPNAACGLGGLVNATIPPRLIRVALLFHF